MEEAELRKTEVKEEQAKREIDVNLTVKVLLHPCL